MPDTTARSEKMEELLGFVPSWIVRWGITVIFVFIFIILFVSWIIKYPEVIESTIFITNENPPIYLVAKSSGKIQKLLVKNNQEVKAGEVLGIIENSADYQDVLFIKNILRLKSNNKSDLFYLLKKDLNLGELQPIYSPLILALNTHKSSTELNLHKRKIQTYKNQLNVYNKLTYQINRQTKIIGNELGLLKTQYERDSSLTSKKLISNKELENSRIVLLNKEYEYESSISSLSNTQLQIMQLQQTILDLEVEYENQLKQNILYIDKASQELLSQIKLWEQRYILFSDINGYVSFTDYWSENQNVIIGENVMTIIPFTGKKLIGKIKLPIWNSGKVRIKQKAIIKLQNYPYQEYGTIVGIITQISKVTSENNYILEVDFPKGLLTSYNKQIKNDTELFGTADIVTDDIRLIERFFQPLKSIFKNKTAVVN